MGKVPEMEINVFCFPGPQAVTGREDDHCEFVVLPGLCALWKHALSSFNMGWTGPPEEMVPSTWVSQRQQRVSPLLFGAL